MPEFFEDLLHARERAKINGHNVSLVLFNQIIPGSDRTHPRIILTNRVSMCFEFPYLNDNSVATLMALWFPDECAELKRNFETGDENAKKTIRLITSQMQGRFDYISKFAALHKNVYQGTPWSYEKVLEQIAKFSGLETQLPLSLV